MSDLHWFPFYWGKYSNKTMHLTQAQHGAYILFLHWIYTTEKPIPHKQRFSIARASLDLERSDASFVLEQFFVRRGQFWHNETAEKVIVESKEKHERRARAGQIGGLKKASNAIAMPEHCSTNYTHTHTHTHQEESKKGKILNFVVGKSGSGNGHTTIKDPADRLARFQNTLVKAFPDLKEGWLIIGKAMDPKEPDHHSALLTCQLKAKQIGKGWPRQWPD